MDWKTILTSLTIVILITTTTTSIVNQPVKAETTTLAIEGFTDGRGITAYLYNTGAMNLSNITWTMRLDGHMALMKKTNGTITLLQAHNHTALRLKHPFGFGRFTLNVTAAASGGTPISAVRNMRLTGFVGHILLGEPQAQCIKLQLVASGLHAPTVLASPGDGSGRLFICEQRGIVYMLKNGRLSPFLDLRSKIVRLHTLFDERGLLGLAFSPNYKTNGKFYVYYSTTTTTKGMDHDNIVSEFTVSGNPNAADPNSERVLLRVPWPQFNHNAGKLAFGPDGYLYIGMGDGGGEGDPHGTTGNAQNLSNFYGKILRIDVNNQTGYGIPGDNPLINTSFSHEIFAWGFRNPFRFSFDPTTGRLFCADVGEYLWEEIDLVSKGGNYGWKAYEGFHPYDLQALANASVNVSNLTFPIFEYSHLVGLAVIGGFVYRGQAIPGLVGDYVFADWSKGFVNPSGRLYYLNESSPGVFTRYEFSCNGVRMLHQFVLSFGQDDANELYVLTTKNPGPHSGGGQVFKILPGK